MKTLSCMDLGQMDCHFVARGETDDEVMDQIIEHGDEMHGEKMREMRSSMSEDEIKDMMRSKIKTE